MPLIRHALLVRVVWRVRRGKDRSEKKLGHAVMEMGKSQDLQSDSAGSRPRTANCVVPIQGPSGLRSKESQCSASQSRKTDVPVWRQAGSKNSVLGEGQSVLLSSSAAFCSVGGPHLLIYSVYSFVLISSKNVPTGTPRIMLDQISRDPVIQLRGHIKLTITRANCL